MKGTRVTACAVATLLVVSLAAQAAMVVDIPQNVKVVAQSGESKAVFGPVLNPLPVDGQDVRWALAQPYEMWDDGVFLGRIDSLEVILKWDPAVSLNFAVTAGGTATTFTFSTSALVTSLTNPMAYATAGMTATDLDNDGATVTGLLGTGQAYEAIYNGSSVYADLVGSFTAPVNSTNVVSDRKPASGWGSISGSVNSIEAKFSFTLSANDSASGTSKFEVIPEPGSLSLLALAGLGLLRRSRK